MTSAQQPQTLIIAVTGTLDNGAVFFTAERESPVSVTIGDSTLPPTVEQAITSLKVGETAKVRVAPEEGYGQRQQDLLQVIDNPEMVQALQPKPGMILSLKINHKGSEEMVPATVIEVDGTLVTVDYNHPLAGHHLNYEIEVLEIK